MKEELKYNLPGFGFATCSIMGEAVVLNSILEENNLINKMKNTCQLGTMKYVYPGAHHTRYEYVFTQLMLIHNIRSEDKRNIELSLSSNLCEYNKFKKDVSGKVLLQCLAMLSNAGHMYDTFTSSRILLDLLIESKESKTDFYKIYKSNLPKEIKNKFDEILNDGNYYKLHLFNLLHILKEFRRKSKYRESCDLYICMVIQLLDSSLIKNEATSKIFYLYKKIRKIAYLSMDMVYTPASVGANLNRMIFTIPSYIDDLFDDQSAMNKSLNQLEEIIHQQIYNSAMSILNNSLIFSEKYDIYRNRIENIKNIVELRKLFLEQTDAYEDLHSVNEPNVLKMVKKDTTLILSKDCRENDCYTESLIIKKAMNKLPKRIVVGTQIAQNLNYINIVYALTSVKNISADVKRIISQVMETKLYNNEYKLDIVKYAIKSLYKYDQFYFNLSLPKNLTIDDCVFIGNETRTIADQIAQRVNSLLIDKEKQHEINSVIKVLDELNYRGLVLCYIGNIRISSYQENMNKDELDGFIYLPNKALKSGFAYIIEAKNFRNGENEAKKQLEDTKKFLCEDVNVNIYTLKKCAYMEISK